MFRFQPAAVLRIIIDRSKFAEKKKYNCKASLIGINLTNSTSTTTNKNRRENIIERQHIDLLIPSHVLDAVCGHAFLRNFVSTAIASLLPSEALQTKVRTGKRAENSDISKRNLMLNNRNRNS